MHACSMHSNAPGKSGQQWSLGRLTGRWLFVVIYSYFEKGCGKNVHATIPKGNMGYDQYTVPDDCSCRTYFCCFPLARKHISMAFPANSFKFLWKKRTQNHPQCLSGLSGAFFPTTFLEIAVYKLLCSLSPFLVRVYHGSGSLLRQR